MNNNTNQKTIQCGSCKYTVTFNSRNWESQEEARIEANMHTYYAHKGIEKKGKLVQPEASR